MITQVTVEKQFKIISCGSVEDSNDEHGNQIFIAHNIIDKYSYPFYDRSAARHWLWLVGMVRG